MAGQVKDDLPPIIRLSETIFDRAAGWIIEWDGEKRGRLWVDNGSSKYFFDGEDAKLLWSFYHPENPGQWT